MKLSKEQKRIYYAILFPALIETVLSRLFLVTDSIMLGQMHDSTLAVAAVGLCGAPVNLIIGVTSSFFIGTTATIAWHYGANDRKQVRSITYQSMLIAVGIALVFSALSIFGARGIMRFVCGTSETLALATEYYKINAYGFFFQILTMNITAAFRGIGVTRLPMLYNLAGGLLNVFLNYLLIYGRFGFPELRSAGAAWATSIAKVFSFLLALAVLLWKKTPVQYRHGVSFKPSHSVITRLLPIGLTSAGEQVILQGGAMMTAKIIAVLPTQAIAANQVVANMEAFAWSTGSACNTASTSLFGRCLGEGNEGKGKAYLNLVIRWGIGFALAEIALLCLAGKPLAALFTNDTSLYPMIVQMLFIAAVALPFINLHQTVSGALRSAGDSVAPLIASLISLWIFRVGMGYLTISVMDLGIYAYRWCLNADHLIRCTTVMIFFWSGHWKRKCTINTARAPEGPAAGTEEKDPAPVP